MQAAMFDLCCPRLSGAGCAQPLFETPREPSSGGRKKKKKDGSSSGKSSR